MSKTCNGCGTSNQPISVPYIVHESSMVRAERQAKRLISIIILLIVLLVGSNIGWLIYESQFETVETVEEYAIEQNAESGNNNSIINGGEIINGKAEDNIQENN
jgi:hypothetical protein